MLVLLFVSSCFQAVQPNQARIRLVSPEYNFASGRATIFRSEPLNQASPEIVSPNGKGVSLSRGEVDVQSFLIVDGSTDDIEFERPGIFVALLSDVRAVRRSDNRGFRLQPVMIHGLTVTALDIQRGEVQVQINSRAFRVVVSERGGKPIPGGSVYVSDTRRSLTCRANENGEVFLLGDPHDYTVTAAVPDPDSVMVQLLPL